MVVEVKSPADASGLKDSAVSGIMERWLEFKADQVGTSEKDIPSYRLLYYPHFQ